MERLQRRFDNDLNKFRDDLLKLAALTEESINRSIVALKNQDVELAKEIVDNDNTIDEMELVVEGAGIHLLACYQPMAIDLRLITTGVKIASELESIADLIVNISYKVINLADQPKLKPLVDIPQLAEIARIMTKKSIDAFVDRSESLAKEVISMDPQADGLRDDITKELIYDYMVKDGKTAPRAVSLLLVTRDLERICDHAVNIAEDTIYIIKAKVVKHHPENLENGHSDKSEE